MDLKRKKLLEAGELPNAGRLRMALDAMVRNENKGHAPSMLALDVPQQTPITIHKVVLRRMRLRTGVVRT